jgi:hypothetical protein
LQDFDADITQSELHELTGPGGDGESGDHDLIADEVSDPRGLPSKVADPTSHTLIQLEADDFNDLTSTEVAVDANENAARFDPIADEAELSSLKPSARKSADTPAANSTESEPIPDDGLPLAVKLKATDPGTVEKYIRLEKVKAAMKNRQGDKAGAMEGVKAYKALESRLKDIQETKEAQRLEAINKTNSRPAARRTSAQAEEVKVILARQKEYKMAALQAKKCNDLTGARTFLAIAKSLDPVVESIRLGQVPDNFVLPPPPSSAVDADQKYSAGSQGSATSTLTSKEAKISKLVVNDSVSLGDLLGSSDNQVGFRPAH